MKERRRKELTTAILEDNEGIVVVATDDRVVCINTNEPYFGGSVTSDSVNNFSDAFKLLMSNVHHHSINVKIGEDYKANINIHKY